MVVAVITLISLHLFVLSVAGSRSDMLYGTMAGMDDELRRSKRAISLSVKGD